MIAVVSGILGLGIGFIAGVAWMVMAGGDDLEDEACGWDEDER